MITVPLEGVFCWKLVFDYDNSSNAGSITHTYRYKTIRKFSHNTFLEKTRQSLSETQKHLSQKQRQQLDVNCKSETGAAYKFSSANVDYRDEEIHHFFSTTVKAQVDTSEETTSEVERKCVYPPLLWYGDGLKFADVIGPHSKLSLYQHYFVAPGITIAWDVHSTTKRPNQPVRIDVQIQPVEFVSGIRVGDFSHCLLANRS